MLRKIEMKIEILQPSHLKQLLEFFLGLSNDTVFLMNRFGKVNNKTNAMKVSDEMVYKMQKEELGFVAIEKEKIIGYGFLRFFGKRHHLLPQKDTTCSLGIVVADNQQGKGIGKKLMGAMIRKAKEIGMRKIWLATYAHNIPAFKLYRKLGFEIEGIFMHDEHFGKKDFHVVSMARFLDGRWHIKERRELIKRLEGL